MILNNSGLRKADDPVMAGEICQAVECLGESGPSLVRAWWLAAGALLFWLAVLPLCLGLAWARLLAEGAMRLEVGCFIVLVTTALLICGFDFCRSAVLRFRLTKHLWVPMQDRGVLRDFRSLAERRRELRSVHARNCVPEMVSKMGMADLCAFAKEAEELVSIEADIQKRFDASLRLSKLHLPHGRLAVFV